MSRAEPALCCDLTLAPQGEAVVVQNDKEVNRLFRADFFGEQALLNDEPRRVPVVLHTQQAPACVVQLSVA